MKSLQIGSAKREPYPSRAIVLGWSNPTHTPTTTDDEKPTNHASLKSSVVPVLPPDGNLMPQPRAADAVPRSITSSSIETIWNAVSAEITRSLCVGLS